MTNAQWRLFLYCGLLAFIIALPLTAAQMGEQEVNATNGPKLALPAQVQAQPGKFFSLKLDTTCKWIKWTIPPGLERVPTELTALGEKQFVGYGPAGVYEFLVVGTLNDVYAETKAVVFVGQPVPPGPLPPVPPSPLPPNPGPNPADPLLPQLQAAYTADTSKDKAGELVILRRLYNFVGKMGVADQDVKTTGELMELLKKSSRSMLGPDALHGIRDLIKGELSKCLPGQDVPLTDDLRKKAETCFDRISTLLGAIR